MPSLFCDIELAARIERAEAQLIALVGAATRRRTNSADGFAIPIAGGLASFAEHGSPYNKVVGLGFGGVPGTTALDEIERAFAARGAPTQIELAHLADPEIGELLTGRGYRAGIVRERPRPRARPRDRAHDACRYRGPAKRGRGTRRVDRRRRRRRCASRHARGAVA